MYLFNSQFKLFKSCILSHFIPGGKSNHDLFEKDYKRLKFIKSKIGSWSSNPVILMLGYSQIWRNHRR